MATKFWPPEVKSGVDRRGGRIVRQLTTHKAHSFHLPQPWWDQGRKLLFASDRGGKSNLFSVDLQNGGITQHTDGDLTGPPIETSFLFASVNPVRPETYFWRGSQLIAVDLVKNQERVIYRADANFIVGATTVTSDGKSICSALVQNMSDRVPVDLLGMGAGSKELWEAKPESRIIVVPADGGAGKELWRERAWLGRVSASPTQPNVLLYCHEGPAEEVTQLMWGLDLRVGKPWAIRPAKTEQVQGPYWHADGVNLGYVLAGRSIGRTRYDGGAPVEFALPSPMSDLHSLGQDLVVGTSADSNISALRWNGVGYDGPRIVCEHRASSHVRQLDPRPRLSPDSRKVVFTSDRTGYAQVYEAEIG